MDTHTIRLMMYRGWRLTVTWEPDTEEFMATLASEKSWRFGYGNTPVEAIRDLENLLLDKMADMIEAVAGHPQGEPE